MLRSGAGRHGSMGSDHLRLAASDAGAAQLQVQVHPPASMPSWKLVPLVSTTSAAICGAAAHGLEAA